MIDIKDIEGKKITIMGLGLHGGGVSSAAFFASSGAEVTVTDLGSEKELLPSIEKLKGFSIRYVLGKHENSDFSDSDMVIKNPAVPLNSPFLKLAKRVETDISIFLYLNKRPLIAVTGSKGKSTTSSAIYHVLRKYYPGAKLGGNITVSPLTFIGDTSDSVSPVILELSSWQLADIGKKNILKPCISIITNIFPDHQNRYSNMEEYVTDKKIIYSCQTKGDSTICNYDDSYGKQFAEESRGDIFYFSKNPLPQNINGAWIDKKQGFLRKNGKTEKIISEDLSIPGSHNRINLLCAGTALSLFGIESDSICRDLASFTGIPHRLELAGIKGDISFYNDSAATIPEAVAAAVRSFKNPVLITGGTDKKLDFSVFGDIAGSTEDIYLLKGSAAGKIASLLDKNGRAFYGPYTSLKEAVLAAVKNIRKSRIILFSPGCASFEMFKNEFDRGNEFRRIVNSL